MGDPLSDLRNTTIVPTPSRQLLDERQQTDYAQFRRTWITWLLEQGKDPERFEGYAVSTVEARANRVDQFYRWVWQRECESDSANQIQYTRHVTHEDADDYLKHLLRDTRHGDDHIANTRKAIQSLFKWQAHERNGETYDPEVTITNDTSTTTSRDYVTREEREQLREAALEYDSIPHYNSVSPEERQEWKRYLSRKFSKPINAISPEDWQHVQGWKIPSLVWTALDAGLRPVEVKRAKTGWVDTNDGVLRIPKADSAKNTEQWTVALTERTATALAEWIEERPQYSEYGETDALWLTREGNTYTSQRLSRLLRKLCDVAGIPHENRDISWYSIRRGMVTAMIDEADLSTAQTQARHLDPRSTARYDQAPTERRRDTLEQL